MRVRSHPSQCTIELSPKRMFDQMDRCSAKRRRHQPESHAPAAAAAEAAAFLVGSPLHPPRSHPTHRPAASEHPSRMLMHRGSTPFVPLQPSLERIARW